LVAAELSQTVELIFRFDAFGDEASNDLVD